MCVPVTKSTLVISRLSSNLHDFVDIAFVDSEAFFWEVKKLNFFYYKHCMQQVITSFCALKIIYLELEIVMDQVLKTLFFAIISIESIIFCHRFYHIWYSKNKIQILRIQSYIYLEFILLCIIELLNIHLQNAYMIQNVLFSFFTFTLMSWFIPM